MQPITISTNVINNEEVNSVNARELYTYLNIKKHYADWIKSQIESLGLEENIDYLTNHKKVNRQTLKEYIITLDTAKHIAMASRTKKGKEIRAYFIEIERSYKRALSNGGSQDLLTLQKELIETQKALIASLKASATNLGERWTHKEDMLLKELKSKGYTFRYIAELMGNRTYQAVKSRYRQINENIEVKQLPVSKNSNMVTPELLAKLKEEIIEEMTNPELLLKINGKLWTKHHEHYIKTGEIQ